MELLRQKVQPRRYQEAIFAQAAQHNTLVVLPTGLGKTMISVLLTLHRMKQYPEGKILMLAPTKPLVQQHEKTFREFVEIPEEKFALFTGAIPPAKRQLMWQDAQVIFSTPQGLENDVLSGKISFEDVSLIVFDEAHRAVKEYSYVFLSKQYEKQARNPRVLGLTASPGTDEESISEVCTNLFIEEIEVRSSEDSDVKPYVQPIDITWKEVSLPDEIKIVKVILDRCYQRRISDLRARGAFKNQKFISKRSLLGLQSELQGMLARGERDMDTMKAISVGAEALKIHHALELINTQGLYALQQYYKTIQDQATKGLSKAVKNIVCDPDWKTAMIKTAELLEQDIEHPKFRELKKTVLQHTNADSNVKIIVFSQYRDQGVKILAGLKEIGVSAKMFVGQAKKNGTGMSQKEQKSVLEEFGNGEFSCLIATSVAEEGLDIPKVDLVVFYEPIPSAIRTVQRRGRTGRNEKGKVIVFVTKDTADVGYRWSAHHKEKRMYRAITSVKKKFRLEPKKQKTLLEGFKEEKQLKVICDYREKGSPVMKDLLDQNVQLELAQLAIGDYQISDRVVIEYKRVPDFVDSMLDGRLLQQLKALSQYTRPIMIIEGVEDIYSVRRVHANAIRGMLATIMISYNIPIINTKNPRETAGLLIMMAKREQIGGKDWQYHTGKPLSDDALQEYIVAAFPGIGNQLAKPLLKEFKSVKNIVNASEKDLQKVKLIGKKKAERIKEISEREYGSD